MRGIPVIGLVALLAACSSSSSGGGGDGGLQCPSGSVVCGSVCANVQGDPQNCGHCGVVCQHGEICDLGGCTAGISDAAHEATTDAPADGTSDAPGDAPAESSPSGDASTD